MKLVGLMEQEGPAAIIKMLAPKRASSEVVAVMDDHFRGVGHPVSVAQPTVAEITVLGEEKAGIEAAHCVKLRRRHGDIIRGEKLRVGGIMVKAGVDNINQRLAGLGINIFSQCIDSAAADQARRRTAQTRRDIF